MRLFVPPTGKDAGMPATPPTPAPHEPAAGDPPVGLAAAAPLDAGPAPDAPASPENPVVADAGGNDSVGTVIIAGLANLTIAVAKLIAGLLSGSAAMLSESAHSVADTVTEVFLYVALRRGEKPADEEHPFGYGKESFVW